MDSVLSAIYAAYGSGWDDVAGADPRRRGLADEALDLARLLTHLMSSHAEALGLLALILHCEARRNARRGADGSYLPLSSQNVSLWSLEVVIQSAHARRRLTGKTDWNAVALLYEGLVQIAPTVGGLVGRAAAVREARGPEAARRLLGQIASEIVASYQPYWACAAHVLEALGRYAESHDAAERAVGLSDGAAIRDFPLKRFLRNS